MAIIDLFSKNRRSAAVYPSLTGQGLFDLLNQTFDLDTPSGVRVTEETALENAAVWACQRLISETLGSLPCITYRKNGKARDRAEDTPAYRILKDKPNPHMTAPAFWETLAGHCSGYGGAFAEKQIDGSGNLIGLWPLLPKVAGHRTRAVIVNKKKYIETKIPERDNASGVVRYESALIPANRCLHIPGIGFDGLNGYPVMHFARKAIGWGAAIEEHAGRFFGQGTNVGMTLTHPGELSSEARTRLRDTVRKWHEGLGNSHRLMLLEEGMKAEKLDTSPKDSMIPEQHRDASYLICRFWGVQPHMIGLLDNATYSNIENQSLGFAKYTMGPWLRRFEASINRDCLGGSDELYAEFLVDSLLRGDQKGRYESYSIAVNNGFMNRDEVRARENLNPIPDGSGQEFTVQLAMASLAEATSGEEGPSERGGGRKVPAAEVANFVPQPTSAPGALPGKENREGSATPSAEERAEASASARLEIRRAFRSSLTRSSQHFVNKEARRARRLLAKAFKESTGEPLRALDRALDKFYEDFGDSIKAELLPSAKSFADLLVSVLREEVDHFGPDAERAFAPVLESKLGEYADFYAGRHIDASRRQIAGIAAETEPEELQQALDDRFQSWEEDRADRIARNESTRIDGLVALALYAAAGVAFKVWRTVGENCPICRPLDGKKIAIAEPFFGAGDIADGGENYKITMRGLKHHPPIHDGCDCAIVAG